MKCNVCKPCECVKASHSHAKHRQPNKQAHLPKGKERTPKGVKGKGYDEHKGFHKQTNETH